MIETFVYSETNVCGCYVIGDSYVFILQLAVSLVKFCKWTKSAFYFDARTYNCISIYCKVKLVLMKLYKNCLIKIGGWTHSAIPLRRQMHNMTENISWNIPLCSDGHSLISFKIFLGMEITVSREKNVLPFSPIVSKSTGSGWTLLATSMCPTEKIKPSLPVKNSVLNFRSPLVF